MKRQHGIATALVLWMTGALMLLAAAMAWTTRTQAKLVTLQQHTLVGQALGEAASNLALREMQAQQAGLLMQTPPPPGPYEQSFNINGHEVLVIASSANGLVNINAAGEELLTALLSQAGGLPLADALALAQTIKDWRDADQIKMPMGAEDDDYLAAGRSDGARDGDFVVPEDLRQVLGLAPDVFDRISGLITVWGDSGSVNPTHAPIELLEVLYAARLKEALPILQSLEANAMPPAFDGNLPVPDTSKSSVMRLMCLVTHPDGVITRYVRWVDTSKYSASGLPWLTLRVEPPTHSKPTG